MAEGLDRGRAKTATTKIDIRRCMRAVRARRVGLGRRIDTVLLPREIFRGQSVHELQNLGQRGENEGRIASSGRPKLGIQPSLTKE